MIKALSIVFISVAATVVGGCANNPFGGTTAESPAAQRDYELLSGTWQLTRGVVNGKAVPASVARNTILGQQRWDAFRWTLHDQSEYHTQTSGLNCRRRT